MTVLQNLVLVVLVFITIVYGDEHNHIVSIWMHCILVENDKLVGVHAFIDMST